MWWWTVALAEELRTVPVGFQEAVDLPWFEAVSVVTGRGTAKGDDCVGAVRLALEDAGRQGTPARVVQGATDQAPAHDVACRQRLAGDAVSASVVELQVLVFTAAPGDSRIPAERWFQVVGLLDALAGDQTPGVIAVDGKVWARLATVQVAEPWDSGRLDGVARGARIFADYVVDLVPRWSAGLGAVPELAGAAIEVVVPSEKAGDRKSKRLERFRVVVPTDAAVGFAKGELTDPELAARCRLEVTLEGAAPTWSVVALDVEGAELRRTEGVEVEQRAVDVKDEDLIGVEDEP